jgi:poly-gamma-glutamate capsule biosynthesis protein CapA/YwtB (metallophosphatase superfamily)
MRAVAPTVGSSVGLTGTVAGVSFAAVAVVAALLGASCGCGDRPADTELHTVTFAGDTVVGRRMNLFLEKHGTDVPLAGVRDVLSRADLTIVNFESIVGTGGEMAVKGPWGLVHYRGRPESVGVLTSAGIDVASLANNHALDYGPETLFEGMEILRRAGISPVGAGKNLDGSMEPVFHKLGDTVVGVIAVHTTQSRFAATADKPGNNFASSKPADAIVERVRQQVARAREHAHVVLLAIHWGGLRARSATKTQRSLARRFVEEAGVDAVLGSGRHILMGVEVIDGRPIVYDAGNLVIDFANSNLSRTSEGRGGIFELRLGRGGVRRLDVTPIALSFCKAELATGDLRDEILAEFVEDSGKLGTAVALEGGRAVIAIDGRYSPEEPRKPFEPPPRVEPRVPEPNSYPPKVVVDRVPDSATARQVGSDAGIEMLGFEMSRVLEKGQGVRLSVYFRALSPVPESYTVFAEVESQKPERDRWRGDHTGGGWVYPTNWWKPGQIVRDTTLVRCPWPPEKIAAGTHKLYIGMRGKRGKVLWDVGGDGPAAERVYLGSFEVK